MKIEPDYKSLSDEDLMELYQKDQVLAFEVLYQRFSARVMAYLRKRVGSEKAAQDLAQEVFLKLHRSKSQYNRMLAFAPWIFSITRSVFLDAAKKKNLEELTLPEEFDRLAAAELVSLGEARPEMLELLPDSQKQAVALRILDEATFDEIAARLSTSPENARQLFSRGLKQLKNRFKGKESK